MTAVPAKCPECDALASKRERLWRVYSAAVAIMNASYVSTDAEAFMKLRAAADKARIDFNLVETEFRQHQDRHAVPN